MKIKCKNKRCIEANNGKPYEWDYRGENPFYANCPRCKSSVKIEDQKQKDTSSTFSAPNKSGDKTNGNK